MTPILGIIASSISGYLSSYFVGYLSGTAAAASQSDLAPAIATDSSKNMYVAGTYKNSSGFLICYVAKFNASGTLQWQRENYILSNSSLNFNDALAVDSSGNVYVGGMHANGTATGAFLIKYNSSGTLQWQRSLQNPASGNNARIYRIAIDSSGNPYAVGEYYSIQTPYSEREPFVVKYNSSGVLQWQRYLSNKAGSAANESGYGIAVDSSANVYITGLHVFTASANQMAFIAKYNSSGTLQWQRWDYISTSAQDVFYCAAVDSSGNIYVAGRQLNAAGSGYIGTISKYNSSGTVQWRRTLTSPNVSAWQYLQFKGIAVDSSANVYVISADQNIAQTGNFATYIFKYNTSGTIQWQRRFIDSYTVPGNAQNNNIVVDSGNDLLITSGMKNSSGGINAFIARIPNDGSKTGTYVIDASHTITYGTPSYTDAASTSTESAATATDFAGTIVDSAGAATDAAGPLTTANVGI